MGVINDINLKQCDHKKYGGTCGTCGYNDFDPVTNKFYCGESETLKAMQEHEDRPIDEDREFEDKIMAQEGLNMQSRAYGFIPPYDEN